MNYRSYKFGARLCLSSDAEDELLVEAWDKELTPPTGRPTREWVTEHLHNLSLADLRRMFSLPDPTKNYEVVFTGQIAGWYCDASQEYDEEISSVDWFLQQELPADYFDDSQAEGLPWCEPCGSYHSRPRDSEHHQALQCKAPFISRGQA